jgi:hypothetical protein
VSALTASTAVKSRIFNDVVNGVVDEELTAMEDSNGGVPTTTDDNGDMTNAIVTKQA